MEKTVDKEWKLRFRGDYPFVELDNGIPVSLTSLCV